MTTIREDPLSRELYRERLRDLESTLSGRITREMQRGRDGFLDVAADAGEHGVADETALEGFSEADTNSTMLVQVREALGRLDAGTFGRCVMDDGAIEPARLEAAPWVRYCLKHQTAVEAGS